VARLDAVTRWVLRRQPVARTAYTGGTSGVGLAGTASVRTSHPFARVDQVSDLGRVVRIARDLMLANLGHWDQITTGDPRPGRAHWVFERAGRPCWHSGTPVRVADQGDPLTARLTYWCPTCQRAPDRSPSS
jgi:hypothetical protein